MYIICSYLNCQEKKPNNINDIAKSLIDQATEESNSIIYLIKTI